MKPSEIVKQLIAVLPKYTNRFSDTLNATLTSLSDVVTVVTTEPHNLSSGDAITSQNVLTPLKIISVTDNGNDTSLITIDVNLDHDQTRSPIQTHVPFVLLSGFTDPLWNINIEVVSVPIGDAAGVQGRRKLIVNNPSVLPTLNGNENVNVRKIGGFNGVHKVETVIDKNTFTYSAIVPDLTTTTLIESSTRITGIFSPEIAVEQYTAQPVGKCWCFLVPEPTRISKNRDLQSDAIASTSPGEDPRNRFMSPFSLYVFIPTTKSEGDQNNIGALEAMDIANDELISPLSKSLFGFIATSPLAEQNRFVVSLTGHSPFSYNKSYYIHRYNFTTNYYLTSCDTVENEDAALRNVSGALNYANILDIDIILDEKS